VYAGCVYWPFHLRPWIGATIGAVILVGGVAEALVSMKKAAR